MNRSLLPPLAVAAVAWCATSASAQGQADAGVGSRDAGGSKEAAVVPGRPSAQVQASIAAGETPQAPPAQEEVLGLRAAQLRDLMRGRLDPAVDPVDLLTVDLTSDAAGAEDLLAARALASRPPRSERPQVPGREAYRQALAAFLRLPEARRRVLLARQAKKHQRFLAQAGQLERAQRELREVEAQVAQLRQLLAGELSVDVDPGPLLRLPLFPQGTRGIRKAAKGSPLRALEERIEAARRQRTELLERFASLTSAERTRLLELHARRRADAARRVAEGAESAVARERAALEEQARAEEVRRAQTAAEARAQEAERARQRALEVARKAQSEAQRLLATEKARLLGVEAQMATFEASLTERRAEAEKRRDEALGYSRRVAELGRRSVLDLRKERDADALYGELRATLVASRRRLRALLDEIVADESGVPDPGAAPDPRLFGSLDLGELSALRARVDKRFATLRERERAERWERAAISRDAVVLLNQARLQLLRYTAPSLRAEVTGFGPQGVDQVRSELEQMALMIRYHVQALPREAAARLRQAKRASIAIFFTLLQLALLVVVFRWWRRRADELLEKLYRSLIGTTPRTTLSRVATTAVWYVRRIRKPLEWLALISVAYRLLGSLKAVPEIDFVWIVLLWVLLGATAVLLVDAMAARQRLSYRAARDAPELRIRSLRLIALLVVGSGLVRALTSLSVGEGAIYAWTTTLSWIFLAPVLWLLVRWWRPHIFERLKAKKERNPVLNWVRGHEDGWYSGPAALVGGVYLLGEGLARWAARELSNFEVAQRVSAYLFRSQVEKQVQSQKSKRSRAPLPDDACRSLAPDSIPAKLLEDVAADTVQRLGGALRQPGALAAVVGERGLGKSTVLLRLEGRLDDREVLRVECPRSGVEALFALIAAQLGAASTDRTLGAAAIRRELAARERPPVIAVDDAERLVQPAVGGLAGLERLLELVRDCGTQASWVLALSASAWQVAARVRSIQISFDTVERLRRWTQAQIAELIQARCQQDGIDPDFEELIVPRAFDAGEDAEDRVETGYYRILWDYADGNPAVALFFWRRSLFRDENGAVVVRLFEGPVVVDLDSIPPQLPFILRAIVQLEEADPATVADCTNLPVSDVYDGIQLAVRRGYLERVGEHVRVTQEWFRAITRLLKRQHLLGE